MILKHKNDLYNIVNCKSFSKEGLQKSCVTMSAADLSIFTTIGLRNTIDVDGCDFPHSQNIIDVFYNEHGDKAVSVFVVVYIKRRDATSSRTRSSHLYTADGKDVEHVRATFDRAFNNVRIAATIHGIPDSHVAQIVEPERVKFFLEKTHPLTEAMPDTIPSANKAQREFWTRFLPKDE